MLSVNKIDLKPIKYKKIKDTTLVSIPAAKTALKIGGISALALKANLLSPLLLKKDYNKDNFYNLDNITNTYSECENKLINELVNYSNEKGSHPYNEQKAQHLINCLRSGEQRDFQINALHALLENPKMTNGDDITTIVAQIKHLDKANFWVNQCKTLSEKHNSLNSKELAEIIPKLKVNSINKQEEAINKIYLPHKSLNNPLFLQKFGEYVSSVQDSELADKQFAFFDEMTNKNNVPIVTSIDLISNLDNIKNADIKADTITKLVKKGLNTDSLTLLIPKIKNSSIADLQLKMADYFIEKTNLEFDADTIIKMMTNIETPYVFNIQKNFLNKIPNLEKFKSNEILNILGDIQSKDKADLKYTVINELSKIDKLDGKDITNILTNMDNAYFAEVKLKTVKNLLPIEKLSGNNISTIVANTNSNNVFAIKTAVAKELAKFDKLNGNAITKIVSKTMTEDVGKIQIDAVKELVKNKKLSAENIGDIVCGITNIDLKNIKIDAINKLSAFDKFSGDNISKIVSNIQPDKKYNYAMETIEKLANIKDFPAEDIANIVNTMNFNKYTYKELTDFFITIPAKIRKELKDYSTVQDFYPFKDKYCLNKLEKKELLNSLITHNIALFGEENSALRILFPFLPSDKKEYCEIVPILAKSISISHQNISQKNIDDYFNAFENLSNINGAFLNLNLEDSKNTPKLKYSRENFIKDCDNLLNNLDEYSKKKMLDLFSFSYSIKDEKTYLNGYPSLPETTLNQSNKNYDTYQKLYKIVSDFTLNNKVLFENTPEIENDINNIFKVVPELFTTVGKPQNEYHDFDLYTHTLRVLQEELKSPEYSRLNDKDKKILATVTMLHDISKSEYIVDKLHTKNSASDAFEIIKRLNFSEPERSKAYAIIRNHSWLEYYNKENISELQKTEHAKHIAFTLRQENAFDLVSILCEADLKGSKKNNASYEMFKNELSQGKKEVSRYIRDIQKTAIPLPQNKLPKASELVADGKIVRKLDIGGIKNVVIYLNKNNSFSDLNFVQNSDIEDFSVLVHGLDSEKNFTTFQCLDEIDSTSLLSASYVNLDKGNWKVFRQQGFILDVESDNIHAAYYKDFGSGDAKNIDSLKTDYLFNGQYKPQRDYISRLIKEKLHTTDNEYKDLYQEIKDKSLSEIREEHPFVAIALKQIFMDMQGGEYTFGRNYNEILVTRPKIQGVFAYDKSVTQIPKYLRQYAHDMDIPIIIFED
ncbi:MAG: HD domain-containing protein [bacterium]|nr:HD domain-containing protein [bacterium]